ncbi:hypothetical protein ACLK17_08675 [Escherichia coli]
MESRIHRHHTQAKEVDEHEFFYSQENRRHHRFPAP